MIANFTDADAIALFNSLTGLAMQLNRFQNVNNHEPENAPANGLYCSITLGPIKAIGTSGLNSVSGQVTFLSRIWKSAAVRPLDSIDPAVLAATSALMGAFCGSFTLSGSVRNIDLFAMGAQPGWINFTGKEFRVMEITSPVLINDMWTEVA